MKTYLLEINETQRLELIKVISQRGDLEGNPLEYWVEGLQGLPETQAQYDMQGAGKTPLVHGMCL